MAMSYYDLIKYYYNNGLYTKEQVCVFVRAGRLTEEQYKTIVGE